MSTVQHSQFWLAYSTGVCIAKSVSSGIGEWYFEGGLTGEDSMTPLKKIKFKISEMVVNTSYFNNYSEITEHWLH